MRPFVFQLAQENHLRGWVINSDHGIIIEAEGKYSSLAVFISKLQKKLPPLAKVYSMELSFLPLVGYKSFEIRESEVKEEPTVLILPDIATCPECIKELFNPADRRYFYPFINCTHCGPRFTIIHKLPYDRPHTSMQSFQMCDPCRREYEDPADRRFHAQPIACPRCGPQVELWDEAGEARASSYEAIKLAADFLRQGEILAFKGLGGFLLAVDAHNENAVRDLRIKKQREEKPFALMFPNLDLVKRYCSVNVVEERLLTSPETPIVLLKQRPNINIAPSVAPNNPYLGIMLPYSPLHILLMKEFGAPIVATSGNISEEPIVIDEKDGLRRLKGIARYFLIHNRPIVRHMDDSIARVILGQQIILRRARGYAPLPIVFSKELPQILAVGGQLKNTIAFSLKNKVFLSQHIGDLETLEAYRVFIRMIEDMCSMYKLELKAIACDLHPDYTSTRYAHGLGLPVIGVQHHHAHMASCMGENELEGKVLGVCWDGAGWGMDGNIWGGEFFVGDYYTFDRIATFRSFALPGAEKAIKEPRRMALSILLSIYGKDLWAKGDLLNRLAFSEEQLRILNQILANRALSPLCTSVGRLFDAASSLIGLAQVNRFEGQAAMMLEFAVQDPIPKYYNFALDHTSPMVVEWSPIFEGIIDDIRKAKTPGEIAAKFHNTLGQIILRIAELAGRDKIVLTGGVFQNRYLTEVTYRLLKEHHFQVHIHQRIPPNDGGISLGQILVAASRVGLS
jgi:hydrogenase maturation protein HypF